MCQLIFSFHFCSFRDLAVGDARMDKPCSHLLVPASGVLLPALSPKPSPSPPQPISEPHTKWGASPCHLPPHFLYPPQRTALHPSCAPVAPNPRVQPTHRAYCGASVLSIPHSPSPPPRAVISGERAHGGGGTPFTFLGPGGPGGFGTAGHFGALGRRLRFRFCSPA